MYKKVLLSGVLNKFYCNIPFLSDTIYFDFFYKEKEEMDIVKSTTASTKSNLKKVMSVNDILSYQDLVLRVPVADNVVSYAVKFVSSTRPKKDSSPDFINRSTK